LKEGEIRLDKIAKKVEKGKKAFIETERGRKRQLTIAKGREGRWLRII